MGEPLSCLLFGSCWAGWGGPFWLPRSRSRPHSSPPCPGASAVSNDVVISQVYGGGGNAGATLTHDFIELFNRGSAPIDLTNWSVQYASSTGSTWQSTPLSGTLQPGQYYLVQQALGTGGTPAATDARRHGQHQHGRHQRQGGPGDQCHAADVRRRNQVPAESGHSRSGRLRSRQHGLRRTGPDARPGQHDRRRPRAGGLPRCRQQRRRLRRCAARAPQQGRRGAPVR